MMKNYYLSLVFLFGCLCFAFGQTTLSAGNIAITGFNSDNPDQFAFVLLTDITTGTEIKFTDNGWLSSGGFRSGEGTLSWTANSYLTCGTVVFVDDQSPFVSSSGTITDSNGFALSTNGDQILAYQGADSSPTFLYAINFDNSGWSDSTNTNTSALPSGLVDGATAVDLGEIDNASYNCSVTSDVSMILSAVSDSVNWNTNNTPLVLGTCTYTCSTTCTSSTTWDGTMWDNGVPNMNTEAIINGNYNTDISVNGSFSACNLTINASATLTVSDNSFIEIQNNIVANGNINVTPQGSVVQVYNLGTVSGSGTITVTKKTASMNNWYEYTYWSSPTQNTTIDNGLTEGSVDRRFLFDGQNYLDELMEMNNDNNLVAGHDDVDDNGDAWTPVSGTDIMTPGVGYASTHRVDLFLGPPGSSPPFQFDYIFEGFFNNGNITVPIYRNDSETGDNNWNFIGNPYPSAIDVDLFLAANATVDQNVPGAFVGAIFLWSQNSPFDSNNNGNQGANFAQSDYAIINGSGQTMGGDGLEPSRFIPSGQGFFVSMDNAASATTVSGDIVTTDVVFNNNMRVTGNNDQFFRNQNSATNNANKIWLDLTSDNGVFNQMLVAYINGATNDFDGEYYDVIRSFSNDYNAVIYSKMENNNENYVIQGKRGDAITEDEVIEIGFNTIIDEATIYNISIPKTEGEFFDNNPIFIKDNLLNITHNLKDSDYNFTSEVGEFENRFEIVFRAEALSIDDITVNANALTIVEQSNGDIEVKINNDLTITNVEIMDITGRQVYNLPANSSTEVYSLSKLSQAAYIARVTLSNGQIISKKAIKQQ